jgi:guanosine-3',5'-bis(diphosphate) 3'-pyrophosphohydrolase
MSLSEKARDFARAAHTNQYRRDSGEPYVVHCERVADSVAKNYDMYKESGGDRSLDVLVSAALLHDTLEDTPTTALDIDREFGGDVAEMVVELTSDASEIARVGKTAYLSRKIEMLSLGALFVKLHDRIDNLADYARNGADAERAKAYAQQSLTIAGHLAKCEFPALQTQIREICEKIMSTTE